MFEIVETASQSLIVNAIHGNSIAGRMDEWTSSGGS
jgi:hypothetical protein